MACRYKYECPSYTGWCEGPKQDFSKCVQFLITAYEREKRDGEALLKRFRHLLESDVIARYDEVDPRTKEYKRDIRELDERMGIHGCPANNTTCMHLINGRCRHRQPKIGMDDKKVWCGSYL